MVDHYHRGKTATASSKTLSLTSRRTGTSRTKFTDTQFPADLSSLLDSEQHNGGLSEEAVDFYRNITFVRASTIYPNLCGLFS
jgi:hypothetical protein